MAEQQQQEVKRQNVAIMNGLESFDVIIVCTSTEKQAKYWEGRLNGGKGSVVSDGCTILAVNEDWPGGAGNGLGTLYAYTKAVKYAKDTLGMDIDAQLKAGSISVGLYHTAGKGTRMAPLPGAENNNKPGVKLPACAVVNGAPTPITILESVIKQTGCYAKSRAGRLSVFWGDQVFVPTVSVEYTPNAHADILCSLGPMMNAEEWAEKGMDKYGLIALTESGRAAQVEKVSHAVALDLLSHLDKIKAVGASLGSFSVSNSLLFCLLAEFASELASKTGKLDSDPHFWMPMTLARHSYIGIMQKKGFTEDEAGVHFDRIGSMMTTFMAVDANQSLGTFAPVDVGGGLSWWDYGLVKLYQKNALLINGPEFESQLMRQFFGISEGDNTKYSEIGADAQVDAGSNVTASIVNSGSVRGSVLTNVKCNSIDAENCILVNVTANKIVAKPGSIIYNVVSTGTVTAEADDIQAGVTAEDSSQFIMKSKMTIDGGKAWDEKQLDNAHTFGEVFKMNGDVDPKNLEDINVQIHKTAWGEINK